MKFKVISISLEEADRVRLDKRLRKEGMTRSEYVRSLIRSDVEPTTPTPKRKGAR